MGNRKIKKIVHNKGMFNSLWYNSLTKPFLSPSNFVFPPIWALLYMLIFISLIVYVACDEKKKKAGYIFFLVQILFNISWTPVFFGMQNIALALFIILLLDLFVILTVKEFIKASKIAGILLLPYLIWILFATYLNIGYFVLN